MKKLLIPFIGIMIAGCTVKQPNSYVAPSPTPVTTPFPVVSTKPALSLTQSMQQELATKYKKSVSDVEITISKELDNHAKGMVSFKGEDGGGMWFAIREKGGWLLVHDGQGPMTCQLAEENAFPKELVPGCVNAQGKAVTR